MTETSKTAADRFREAASRIVNTPKAVVDQRAKEYKQARKKAAKARP